MKKKAVTIRIVCSLCCLAMLLSLGGITAGAMEFVFTDSSGQNAQPNTTVNPSTQSFLGFVGPQETAAGQPEGPADTAGSVPAAAATPAPPPRYGWTNSPGVNAREEGSRKAPVIFSLRNSKTILIILETITDNKEGGVWHHIKIEGKYPADDKIGYIRGDLVDEISEHDYVMAGGVVEGYVSMETDDGGNMPVKVVSNPGESPSPTPEGGISQVTAAPDTQPAATSTPKPAKPAPTPTKPIWETMTPHPNQISGGPPVIPGGSQSAPWEGVKFDP